MAGAKAPAAKKAAPKKTKTTKAATAPKAKKTAPKKVESNVVKKTDTFVILKKRSGRYAVKGANRKWVTGEEKIKILMAEGLLKAPAKKKAPAPAAE